MSAAVLTAAVVAALARLAVEPGECDGDVVGKSGAASGDAGAESACCRCCSCDEDVGRGCESGARNTAMAAWVAAT